MKKVLITAGLSILLLLLIGLECLAECERDLDHDGNVTESDLSLLAEDFGRTDCATGPLCEADNWIRRKQFHAKIRDIYNPILRDVLMEYVFDGRLPNAYYVDILDIQFDDTQVNDSDCFHPSADGHELLAEEQWCRSPWGLDDPICLP
jgi:hypothetical protein